MNAVLEGKAQVVPRSKAEYRKMIYAEGNEASAETGPEYVLAYYLMELDKAGFNFEKAVLFSEKIRALFDFRQNSGLLSELSAWVSFNIEAVPKLMEFWDRLIKYPYFYGEDDPRIYSASI